MGSDFMSGLSGIGKIASKVMDVKKVAEDMDILEIFNSDFMKQYTNFSSITELLSKGGFELKDIGDIKSLLGDKLDTYIKSQTKFANWEEMYAKAAGEFLKGKLNN